MSEKSVYVVGALVVLLGLGGLYERIQVVRLGVRVDSLEQRLQSMDAARAEDGARRARRGVFDQSSRPDRRERLARRTEAAEERAAQLGIVLADFAEEEGLSEEEVAEVTALLDNWRAEREKLRGLVSAGELKFREARDLHIEAREMLEQDFAAALGDETAAALIDELPLGPMPNEGRAPIRGGAKEP